MNEKNIIADHQARIGRLGGMKSSPAKRASARAAAMKRWGHDIEPELAMEDLEDGKWYFGKGRNAEVGMWDERSRCFWLVAVSDGVDPERYPEPGSRSVRLKREKHHAGGGTFHPRKILA